MRLAAATKQALVSAIYRIQPKSTASIMSGVVLGSYAYIDDDTLTDFTRAGTLHVLAASGYNCFIILFLAMPLLTFLRVLVMYRSAIVLFLLAFYLLTVGPVPSLVRATVMSALVLLAVPLRRVPNYANLFYVAGLAVLLLNPSDLFDVGFQLSFLAVGALVYVSPLVEAILREAMPKDPTKAGWKTRRAAFARWLERKWKKFTALLASTAVATIAVGLVTGPIVAHYFHYVSLTSLPANLIVAVTTPFIFVDSFISPITSLLPHAPHWAGFVGTAATRAMLGSVSYFGEMKYSSISVQSPGMLGILGYYLVLHAAVQYVRSRFAKR
jgi:competence protein ComEC